MKNNKDGMEYEDVPFKYTKEQQGDNIVDYVGSAIIVGIDTLRQGVHLLVQNIRRNEMAYIVIIFLTGFWLSGWFANSGNAFLSLLSVVLGVVLTVGLSLINGRSR